MNNTSKVLIGLIVIMASVLIVLLVLIFKEKNNQNLTPTTTQKPEQSEIVESWPEGKVYLSLSKKNEQQEGTSSIYQYNIKTNKLEKYLSEDNKEKNKNFSTGQFSTDREKMIFSSSSKEDSQIYTVDRDNKKYQQITFSERESHKRLPSWSPDQKSIAYQSTYADDYKGYFLGNWDIFINNLNGNDRFITKGANPVFLPNGNLLVLKQNGIYLFNNLDDPNDKGHAIWFSIETPITIGMNLSVSNNGKYLALTYPEKVLIFEVNDWSKLSLLNEPTIIKIQASCSVFYPDNKFIIFQEVDEKNENHQLVVYNIETLEKRNLIDLSEYEQFNTFSIDWTK